MTHVAHVIDALHLEDVCFVRGKVGVSLDGGSYLLQRVSVLQFDIYHAAVDALTQGDGHAECILDTGFRAHAYAVTHRHAWAEVSVTEAFWGETLHQCAHDTVAARIPSGSDDADGVRILVDSHQSLTVAADVGMDVEGIDSVDAQGQYLLGKLLAGAGGCGQDGNVNVFQLADVLDDLVGCQFCGLVGSSVASHNACNLKVGCGLQGLYSVLSDVAVTYYGCSDFLHNFSVFFGEYVKFGCKSTLFLRYT